MDLNKSLVIFQNKRIRRIWHKEDWYFSVVDVIAALTDSPTPRQYWSKIKQREFISIELSPIWVQLKLVSSDGKTYDTDCANTESMFRIIQSVPSKKAEPFKIWLAKVGYERIREIESPDLSIGRAAKIYAMKGYSKEWIKKRLGSAAIRQELVEEWHNRGVDEGKEMAILTNTIIKETFGKSVDDYKRHKGVSKDNLRDNMTELELLFTMLGESVTKEITKKEDKDGFEGCRNASQRGGRVVGKARLEVEKEVGKVSF